MTQNLTVKVVCVLLALLLWAQAAARRDMERVVELPLQLSGLPDSLAVRRSATVSTAWVRLRDSKLQMLFHDVFVRSHGRVVIDLSRAEVGSYRHELSVREVLTDATPLAVVSPSTLQLRVHRKIQREVAVRVVMEGQLEDGLILAGRPEVTPSMVELVGPAPVLEALDHVNTVALKISRHGRSFSTTLDLDLPDPDVEMRPVEVDVSFSIDQIVERAFENVPLSVLSDRFDSTRIFVEPESAQLRLRGPGRTLEALRVQDLSVLLHLGDKPGGVYQIEPEVLVPDGVLFTVVDPPSFQVIVDGGPFSPEPER